MRETATAPRPGERSDKVVTVAASDPGPLPSLIEGMRFLRRGDGVGIVSAEDAPGILAAINAAEGRAVLVTINCGGLHNRAAGLMARFFDTRAAYNMFVNATDEKTVVADRVASAGETLEIGQPGLRIFDAGMGDGALLANVMRRLHRRFIYIPWLVVAKEISIEDVRQGLARLPDRFLEHPELVVVVTNLRFPDATHLRVGEGGRWRQVALSGDTSAEFAEQIEGLYADLADDWQVRTNPQTGNPVYVHPAAVILYRADHEFLLEALAPQSGGSDRIRSGDCLAGIPSRHRPRAQSRPGDRSDRACPRPGGRLIGVQAAGGDPGLEIVRAVWPNEKPISPSPLGRARRGRTAIGR